VSPDVSKSKILDEPIGSMYDNATGQVVEDMSHWDSKGHAEAPDGEAEQH